MSAPAMVFLFFKMVAQAFLPVRALIDSKWTIRNLPTTIDGVARIGALAELN
jgi:hypothetical protein